MQTKRENVESLDESDKDTSFNKSFPELAIKDNILIQKYECTQNSQSSSKIMTQKAYDQLGVITENDDGSNQNDLKKQIIDFEQNDQEFNQIFSQFENQQTYNRFQKKRNSQKVSNIHTRNPSGLKQNFEKSDQLYQRQNNKNFGKTNQDIIFKFENFLLNHNQQINQKIENSLERNQSSSDRLLSYKKKNNSTDEEMMMEDKYFMIDPLIQNKIQKYCGNEERDQNINLVQNNQNIQDMTQDFNITEDNRKFTDDQLLLQDTSEDINNFFDLQRFTIQSQNMNNLTASTIPNENQESNKFCASNMNIFDDKQKVIKDNNESKYSQILLQKLNKLQIQDYQDNGDQNKVIFQEDINQELQNKDQFLQNYCDINTMREHKSIQQDLMRETGESSEKRATAQFKSFGESQNYCEKDKIIESLNRRELNQFYLIPDSEDRYIVNVNTDSLENSNGSNQQQQLLNTVKNKSSTQTSGKEKSQSNLKLRQFLQSLNESNKKNPNEINLMYQAPISLKNPSYSSNSSNVQSNSSKQNALYSVDSQKCTEIENIDINIISSNQNSRNRDQILNINYKNDQRVQSSKNLIPQDTKQISIQKYDNSANNLTKLEKHSEPYQNNQKEIMNENLNIYNNEIAQNQTYNEYKNNSYKQQQTQSTMSLQTFAKSALSEDILQLQKRIRDLENKINIEPRYFTQTQFNSQNQQPQTNQNQNNINFNQYNQNNENKVKEQRYNQYQENIRVEDDNYDQQQSIRSQQIGQNIYNNKLQNQRQENQNAKKLSMINIDQRNQQKFISISSESDSQQYKQNQDQNFISISQSENQQDQKLSIDQIMELDLEKIEKDKQKIEEDQIQLMKKQFQNHMKKMQTSVRNTNEFSSTHLNKKESENYQSTSPKNVFQGSYESTQQAILQKNKKKEDVNGIIQESSDEKVRNTFTFQNKGRKQSNFSNIEVFEAQNNQINQMQDIKSSGMIASTGQQFVPAASTKSLAFQLSEQNDKNIKSEMKASELENTRENILRKFQIVNQLCVDRHANSKQNSRTRQNSNLNQLIQNKIRGQSLQQKQRPYKNQFLKISISNSSQKQSNFGKKKQSSVKQQTEKSTQKKSNDKFFSELKKLQEFKNQLKQNFILPNSEIKVRSQNKQDKQHMHKQKSTQSLNIKQKQLGMKSQIIVQTQNEDKKLSGRLNRLGRSRSQEKYLLNNNISKPNTLSSTQFSTSRLISTAKAFPNPISQSLLAQSKMQTQNKIISKQKDINLQSINTNQNSNINSKDFQTQGFCLKNIPQSQTEKLSSRSIQKDLKIIQSTAHSVHNGMKNGSIQQSHRNHVGVFKSLKSLKSQKSFESLPSLHSKSSIRSHNNFSSGAKAFFFMRNNTKNTDQNIQSLVSPVYQNNFKLQLQSNLQESKNQISQRIKRGSVYRQKSKLSNKSQIQTRLQNVKTESQINLQKRKRQGSKAILKKQKEQKTENNNANDILIRKYLRQIQVFKNNQKQQQKQIETLLCEKDDQEKLIGMLEKLVHKFKDTFDKDQKAKEILRNKNQEIMNNNDNLNEQIEILSIQNIKYEKKIKQIEKKQNQSEQLRKEQDDLIKEMSKQISNVQIQIEKLGLQSILNLSSSGQTQSYIEQLCKQSVGDSLQTSKVKSKKKKDAIKNTKKQICVQSYDLIPEESMMSNEVSNQHIIIQKSNKRGQNMAHQMLNQFSSQESLNS